MTLFEPRLLLLDEPDSHLHPDNQVLLAKALQYISSETSTQIIVSTHSRHLVDALQDDAHFVWLKDGKVFQQGVDLPRLPLLLDIGALDSFDKLMAGTIEWVVLSEDTDLTLIKILAASSGFDVQETLFFSYKTSTNLESAKILASFIKEISPSTTVVIHRDRDFMTDEEAATVATKISQGGAIAFVTERSDIESYFVRSKHIATATGLDSDNVHTWIDKLATGEHNKLAHTFTRKRDEVKHLLYRDNPNEFPSTVELLGDSVPLAHRNRLGKQMLKLVRAGLHTKFNANPAKLLQATAALKSARLAEIIESQS